MLAVTKSGKVGNRVGSSHYHQPGRPSPGTITKRRIVMVKNNKSVSKTVLVRRNKSIPATERPKTPETCSSSEEESVGYKIPQPPMNLRSNFLEQMNSVGEMVSRRANYPTQQTFHLRKLKQSYSSFIKDEVILTDSTLFANRQAKDLSSFIECESPFEFKDSTKEQSESGSVSQGGLKTNISRCQLKSSLEITVLETVQKVKYHTKSFPESPSFFRIQTCLETVNTISRHAAGAVSKFMKLLYTELRAAIFIPKENTSDLSDEGIKLTFYNHWLASKVRIAELESTSADLRKELIDLKDEKAKLLQSFVSDSSQLSQATTEITQLKETLEKQVQKITHHKDHSDFLNSQIDELQKALSRAGKRYYDLCKVSKSGTLFNIVGDSDKEIHSILKYNDSNFEDHIDESEITDPTISREARLQSKGHELVDVSRLHARQSEADSELVVRRGSSVSEPLQLVRNCGGLESTGNSPRRRASTCRNVPPRNSSNASSFHASEVSLSWEQQDDVSLNSVPDLPSLQQSYIAFEEGANKTT